MDTLATRLRNQNNGLRVWRYCRRHRTPVKDCPRCPIYTATSSPEALPGSRHGAGASPFYEWLESQQRVTL